MESTLFDRFMNAALDRRISDAEIERLFLALIPSTSRDDLVRASQVMAWHRAEVIERIILRPDLSDGVRELFF